MAKTKYHYDSDTMSYTRVRSGKAEKIKKVLLILGFVCINFIIGFIILSQFVSSSRERELSREIENYELHYELLEKRMAEASVILADLQARDNSVYRAYFEVSEISEEERKAGFGGVNRYKHLEGFNNSDVITKSTKELDILSKQIVIQSKSLDEIVSIAKKKEEMLLSIPSIQPVKKENTRLASGYGMRMHPILKIRKMHAGMDFAAATGTPIYASGNGRVSRAERSDSYGNVVYIKHGYGYETVYAHMSEIKTKKGARVKRGELIGYVGSTGRSSGPHLHYEVHKNGKTVNPIHYYYGNLSPEEYEKMQKASKNCSQSFD